MERGMIYCPKQLSEDQKSEVIEHINNFISEYPICFEDPVLVTTKNEDINIKFFKKEEIDKDIKSTGKTERDIIMSML